jgi:hypothetical protein
MLSQIILGIIVYLIVINVIVKIVATTSGSLAALLHLLKPLSPKSIVKYVVGTAGGSFVGLLYLPLLFITSLISFLVIPFWANQKMQLSPRL